MADRDPRTLSTVLNHRFSQDLISVNFNGHYRQSDVALLLSQFADDRDEAARRRWKDLLFGSSGWLMVDIALLVALPATDNQGNKFSGGVTQDTVDMWIVGEESEYLHIPHSLTCFTCGRDLKMYFNGKTLELKGTEPINDICPYASSDLTHTVELDIPSGEIVFGNDFRKMFEEPEEYSIEIHHNRKKYVNFYAAAGLFHAYVGNSCPIIFQEERGIITVANVDPDELGDLRFGKECGMVTTDLWWFSAMDSAEFIKRRLATEEQLSAIEARVKVTPGRYRMTVYAGVNFDSYEPVYAKIELITEE